MKKNNTKKLVYILSALFFAGNEMSFANSVSDLDSKDNPSTSSIVGKENVTGKNKHRSYNKKKNKKICCEGIKSGSVVATPAVTIKSDTSNYYQPYVQFGGTRFFHVQESKAAATADLFIPLWQNGLSDLVFTDLRINDRSGTPFEGNIHIGYRHLFEESQQAFGVYGAWDRKKTQFGNYFNQLTVGGEYWIQNWFIGANYYQPIGSNEKSLDQIIGDATPSEKGLGLINDITTEKAMPGADAEVGYEFIDGLMGYAGGYYFAANKASTVYGPRVRLTYDWSPDHGRILGIFDKVGLEAGIQRDKPRGTTSYISINARIGWLFDKKSVLKGLSRHMIDPVRRDIDIVSVEVVTHAPEVVSDEEVIAAIVNGGGGSSSGGGADALYHTILKGRKVSDGAKHRIHAHLNRATANITREIDELNIENNGDVNVTARDFQNKHHGVHHHAIHEHASRRKEHLLEHLTNAFNELYVRHGGNPDAIINDMRSNELKDHHLSAKGEAFLREQVKDAIQKNVASAR